jgi:hypothetical protein
MDRRDEDECELSDEQVSALLDKLLADAAAGGDEAETDAIVAEPRPDKLSTPVRRTPVPTVGRPRRKK